MYTIRALLCPRSVLPVAVYTAFRVQRFTPARISRRVRTIESRGAVPWTRISGSLCQNRARDHRSIPGRVNSAACKRAGRSGRPWHRFLKRSSNVGYGCSVADRGHVKTYFTAQRASVRLFSLFFFFLFYFHDIIEYEIEVFKKRFRDEIFWGIESGCRYNGNRLSSGCSKIGVWVCGMKWENDCYEFQLNRGSRTVRFDRNRTRFWFVPKRNRITIFLFFF